MKFFGWLIYVMVEYCLDVRLELFYKFSDVVWYFININGLIFYPVINSQSVYSLN